jgi:hypothetical protein
MNTQPLVRTIQDLEDMYYGRGAPFLMPSDVYANMGAGAVNNSDAPVTSGTTGVYQAVYGFKAWAGFNTEFNPWSVAQKVPYQRSGHRMVTARAGTLGGGNITEGAALPDSIKPMFDSFSTTPKTVGRVYEVSEVQDFLATQTKDDATASMEWIRQWGAINMQEDAAQQLCADPASGATGTALESYDRVCSSYAEANAKSYGGGYDTIYGKARDNSNPKFDAYVNYASANRDLTDALINDVIRNVKAGGGRTRFILTGYDTDGAIAYLYQNQVRYNVLGSATSNPSVNGVQAPQPGHGAGMTVTTIYGIPIIVSAKIIQDTLSRMYFLDDTNPEGDDFPRLSIKVAKPTQYFEAGINSGTPFAVAKFSDKILYRTMAELGCRYFAGQGKLRDIQ